MLALERRRAAAFTATDAVGLATVYTAGAAPLHRDVAVVRRLAARSLRVRGLVPRVRSVTVLSAGSRRAVLRVVDALSSYDVVDATGDVVAHRGARPASGYVVTLRCDDGQWRIAAVRPAAARGSAGQPTSAVTAASTSS